MLVHGGDIAAASTRFGEPSGGWLDISTGISPWSWPVPDVPERVWRELPASVDGLEEAAAAYYGCDTDAVLPVPGSQFALSYLPRLFSPGAIAMPLRGYAEHRMAWLAAGHSPSDYEGVAGVVDTVAADTTVRYALVVNPNNPTGELIEPDVLLELAAELDNRGGCLFVDEAFVDIRPEMSLSPSCPRSGLAVFRSVGKFFGLAGIRLGFLLAEQPVCAGLREYMQPWQVSGPARWLGRLALGDRDWQAHQRDRLVSEGARWVEELETALPLLRFRDVSLFASATGPGRYCESLYEVMGREGVLLRLFEDVNGDRLVRFGLPLERDKARVLEVLDKFSREEAH